MSDESGVKPEIIIYSFGFKHGVPIDAHLLVDVRFLPNPYWQEDLRPLSGRDEQVAAYVIASSRGEAFLQQARPFLQYMAAAAVARGSSQYRVAVGCTGGRHRSVAVVEELGSYLSQQSFDCRLFHRDLNREAREA